MSAFEHCSLMIDMLQLKNDIFIKIEVIKTFNMIPFVDPTHAYKVHNCLIRPTNSSLLVAQIIRFGV